MSPDLVLLGNLLVDDLVFPDGCTRMGQAGGAMLYSSLAAALWGVRVGCVSLRGDDYPEEALAQLRRRGVMLDGIVPLGRPGVRTWLLYEGRVRRVVHRLGCPTHEEVSPGPEHVPAGWRAAGAFHLGPVPFALQSRLAMQLGAGGAPAPAPMGAGGVPGPAPMGAGGATGPVPRSAGGALVSIDPHEIVSEASLERWRGLLAHVDVFFPSEDELRLDDAQTDPHASLRRLANGRLRFIAFKRGMKGGVLYDVRSDRFHEWAPRTNGVADPTGAGDGFAAGFLSGLFEERPVEECVHRGVVTASFAIEAWGPAGLLEATREGAEARMLAWFGKESAA